jgi:hypothetical protein
MSEFDRKLHEDIAAGEAWLSGFDTSPPDAEAISRFKAVVRAELGAARPRRLRLKHWHGALAAAAMILLAVVVGWQSYDRYADGAGPRLRVAEVIYEPIIPFPEESDSISIVYGELTEETDDLGDWSLSDGGGLFAVLEDIDNGDAAAGESEVLQWQPSAGAASKGVV